METPTFSISTLTFLKDEQNVKKTGLLSVFNSSNFVIMIQPILYDSIEQKKVIEREAFSKLTPKERRALKKSWMNFLTLVEKSGERERSKK